MKKKNFIWVLVLGTLQLHAQTPQKVYNIFCTTEYDLDLNAEVTKDLNQRFFTFEKEAKNQNAKKKKGKRKKKKEKKFQKKAAQLADVEDIPLVGKDFNLNRVHDLVKKLQQEPDAIVLVHIFEHGTNVRGDTLPQVQCYKTSSSNRPEASLNPENDILEPLRNQVKFVLVLVDACNEQFGNQVSRGSLSRESQNASKQLSQDEILKKIIDPESPRGKEELAAFTIEKEYRQHPLGLILSSEGWLGISSSSVGEKALAAKDIGGIASFLYYRNIKKPKFFRKGANWLSFLFEFRASVSHSVHYFDKRYQHPIWNGEINDHLLPNKDVLAPEKIEQKLLDPDQEEDCRALVAQFCRLINNKEPKNQFLGLTLNNKTVPIYSDFPITQGKMPGYMRLNNYLKQLQGKPLENVTITFDLDSIQLDGYYKDNSKFTQKEWVGFKVSKQIQWGDNDTTLHRLVLVEIPSGSKYGPFYISRLIMMPPEVFQEEEPKPEPPPPPPPLVDIDTLAKQEFLEDGYAKIDGFHNLLLEATQHFNNAAYLPTIEQTIGNTFSQPDSNQIEYISHRRKKTRSGNVLEYLKHFWDDYPQMYDEANFFICDAIPSYIDKETGQYLEKVDSNLWEGTFDLIQAFQGWKNGRIIYEDKTLKRITIQLENECTYSANSKPCFRTRITNIKVLKIIKNSDCDTEEGLWPEDTED